MRRSLALALAVALGAAAPARAETDPAACRKAYDGQRYDQVASICAEVIVDPTASQAAVLTAWEVIGMANLVVGRTGLARAAFCQALAVSPHYRPSDPIYPARFVAVFEAVRQGGCAVPLRVAAEPRMRGAVLTIGVRLDGSLTAGSRAVVWFRREGATLWQRATAPAQIGVTPVELTGVNLRAAELEYYVTVVTESDRTLARCGAPDQPRRLARLSAVAPTPPAREPARPSAPGGPSFWRRTWVYWAVGAAALATVIAVSAGVAVGGSETPTGTLGVQKLPQRLEPRYVSDPSARRD